jgi:O-antigen ligase
MPLPRAAIRARRAELWGAAARMIADRPLTGVGPDNFRLRYGEYAGGVGFDPRVHANNTYLEVLATSGLAGGIAFAWFCWRAAGQTARLARRVGEPPAGGAAAGVAAAGAAIALHALVDSFVGFTGTYTLMATSLGLIVACAEPGEIDARRV